LQQVGATDNSTNAHSLVCEPIPDQASLAAAQRVQQIQPEMLTAPTSPAIFQAKVVIASTKAAQGSSTPAVRQPTAAAAGVAVPEQHMEKANDQLLPACNVVDARHQPCNKANNEAHLSPAGTAAEFRADTARDALVASFSKGSSPKLGERACRTSNPCLTHCLQLQLMHCPLLRHPQLVPG